MTSTDQTEFVEEGLQCLYLENKTCSFFPTTSTRLCCCNIHMTNFKWASLPDQH